jgi:hypothetical protein
MGKRDKYLAVSVDSDSTRNPGHTIGLRPCPRPVSSTHTTPMAVALPGCPTGHRQSWSAHASRIAMLDLIACCPGPDLPSSPAAGLGRAGRRPPSVTSGQCPLPSAPCMHPVSGVRRQANVCIGFCCPCPRKESPGPLRLSARRPCFRRIKVERVT